MSRTSRGGQLMGMFAKFWSPGLVKTRLARDVGPELAAELHRAMVESLTHRFALVGDERRVAVWPPESACEFRERANGAWHVTHQSPGDLGDRMAAYFAEAFAHGFERAVLIGSDSPTLPVEYVQQAFTELNEHDVVLGPAEDGGYYLIGAARRVPPIFSDIAWSTADVWPATVERLDRAGLAWRRLPTWWDIDELDDVKRLVAELDKDVSPSDRAGSPSIPDHLAQLSTIARQCVGTLRQETEPDG